MAYKYEDEIKEELDCIRFEFIGNQNEMLKELEEVYKKARAFETFIKYNQHVKKYNNSDCHELERVFQGVMEEYEEDE